MGALTVLPRRVGNAQRFGVRRQSAAATALWIDPADDFENAELQGLRFHHIQSGVTLRFPPHSKTLPRPLRRKPSADHL